MSAGILAGAAMGAVFFAVPSIMLSASAVWIGARLLRGEGAIRERLGAAWRISREPVGTAAALMVAGVVLVGFVSGDLGPGTYFEVGAATVELVSESITRWTNPATSRSITVRGFGFIVLVACVVTGWAMNRFYRSRWDQASQIERRTGSPGS